MSRRNLTMEDILNGVSSGGAQYVGNMGVIPLVAEEDRFNEDDFGTVDDIEVGTSDYGTVHVRDRSGRTNFVPPGAGWVVSQAAQDHAVGGGKILEGGSKAIIDTARCIQSSQPGRIQDGLHEMLILPAELRGIALAKRKQHGYDLIWGELGEFNRTHGIIRSDQQLATFMQTFKRQMDQFVAEFELVDNQIGAIVLMAGKVIGIEIAPTRAYWKSLWYPLIRVCYGSLARQCYRSTMDSGELTPGSTREPLELAEMTMEGLRDALKATQERMLHVAGEIVERLRLHPLQFAAPEDRGAGFTLRTIGIQQSRLIPRLGGQVITDDENRVPFFSACTT